MNCWRHRWWFLCRLCCVGGVADATAIRRVPGVCRDEHASHFHRRVVSRSAPGFLSVRFCVPWICALKLQSSGPGVFCIAQLFVS